jgi:hypothetical protein
MKTKEEVFLKEYPLPAMVNITQCGTFHLVMEYKTGRNI